ncbi:uncharacterized protein LOC127701046 [Mytilus californianus]|uniref:uncharacterized protein LOC127701046 n=1 Tax=Mytilus californianus TaxID=6549 RepID=UPI002245A727|nr:uncharacterized protein LOC127701046 [Mytilus californianus]
MSDVRITLNPNQASKMLEVLSAFPNFKRPTDLPDHLRLSKKQIKRIRTWQKTAAENAENPSFSRTNKLTAGAFRIFQDKQLLSDDDDKKSEEKEKKSDKKTDSQVDDDADDSDEDFDGDFGKLFGGLAGPSGKINLTTTVGGKPKVDKDTPPEVIPLMTSMVNKNLMYAPYKANAEALEEWIAENRHTVTTQEIQKREKQLKIIKRILMLYDQEKEGETRKIKEARNMKILELNAAFDDLGDLPPEVETKSKEYYQEADFSKLIPGMMETLQGTMSSLLMGLGNSLNPKKASGKKGGEEECAVM